jgi:hypothetical protein
VPGDRYPSSGRKSASLTLTSNFPEGDFGGVRGRISTDKPYTAKVNCLAPGCNGFRAAFQWEMKCSADEPKSGKVRRGP